MPLFQPVASSHLDLFFSSVAAPIFAFGFMMMVDILAFTDVEVDRYALLCLKFYQCGLILCSG